VDGKRVYPSYADLAEHFGVGERQINEIAGPKRENWPALQAQIRREIAGKSQVLTIEKISQQIADFNTKGFQNANDEVDAARIAKSGR